MNLKAFFFFFFKANLSYVKVFVFIFIFGMIEYIFAYKNFLFIFGKYICLKELQLWVFSLLMQL